MKGTKQFIHLPLFEEKKLPSYSVCEITTDEAIGLAGSDCVSGNLHLFEAMDAISPSLEGTDLAYYQEISRIKMIGALP